MRFNPFDKYRNKDINEKQKEDIRSFSITRAQFTVQENKFIQNFFKDYFSQLSISLSEIVQKKVMFDLIDVSVLQFSEFVEYIPNPSLIVRMDIEEGLTIHPKSLVILDPYIVFIFLDLLLGGRGEVVSKIREFTKLEIYLFNLFFVEDFIKLYNKMINTISIQENKKIGFLNLEKISTETALALAISYSANVAKIDFGIKIETMESNASFVLPFNYLREIVPQQKTSIVGVNPDILAKIIKDQTKTLSEKNIGFSKVEVVVELGQTEILFGDLLNIDVGDIITLDNKIGDDVIIKVEGKKKFLGSLGIVGNKIGVKINKPISEDED